MSQVINQSVSSTKEAGFIKKFDRLLDELRANNQATLEIYKDINKLRRSNDVAFNRAKKAVEALSRN